MTRGEIPRKQTSRRMLRAVAWLALLGLLALAAGPLYAFLGVSYSGELVLAQQASAADVLRGFTFGPVYLREGLLGRYFITAVLPAVEEESWHTTFEVLNDQQQPVFRQDEIRFIGDFHFTPGQRDRYHKTFALDKQTGYYYFRFTALTGGYSSAADAEPVVEFAVRQGVLAGWALWGPAAGLMGLGVILLWVAGWLLARISRDIEARRADAGTGTAPSRTVRLSSLAVHPRRRYRPPASERRR